MGNVLERMRTPLQIVADDFGLAPAIDRAVFAGLARGVVSTAALMPTSPYAASLLRHYVALGYRSVGWHVTLSEPSHQALTEASSLKGPEANLNDRDEASRRLLASTEDTLHELHLELSAQLNVIESAGLKLSHVSSHHHLHVIPSVAQTLALLLKERGHDTVAVRGYGKALGPTGSKAHALLAQCAASAMQTFEQHGFATTRTIGFRTMHTPDLATLRDELEHAKHETARLEWMVHLADYGPTEAHLSLERTREFALVSQLLSGSIVQDFEFVSP
jgi:predicted glycoside hydrolase/deacetylase ChbG (UPF0249 family)